MTKHIIPKQSKNHISNTTQENHLDKYYSHIRFILEEKNRPYLTVFKLDNSDNDTSLTDTIFLAIYTGLDYQKRRFSFLSICL